VKRLTKNLLGIRILTLGVLVVGIMTMSLVATSWATPYQAAQAQTIGEPPSTPERADDEGAQLVINPGDAPTAETRPIIEATPVNGDTIAPDAPVRPQPGVAPAPSGNTSPEPRAATYTRDGTTVTIQPDGQVTVTLTDGRTLLLGAVQDLTFDDFMHLPISAAERQAILHAQYHYALRQTTASATLFAQKARPQTVFTLTDAEVTTLPVTDQERVLIRATQMQYTVLRMQQFVTRFLATQ
jgi:hypothetical protein